MLINKDAHLQTTFNRHRSLPHQFGIVNRQCGLGNFKYAVILDPMPTGHMTRCMPLAWANASLRLYISLTVQVKRMVTMHHNQSINQSKKLYSASYSPERQRLTTKKHYA